MAYLSITDYDYYELSKKHLFPNRFLEAFQPEVFQLRGFPTRVSVESELVRFIDSMHDGRWKEYYNKRNFQPTQEEFLILKNIAQKIYDFSVITMLA